MKQTNALGMSSPVPHTFGMSDDARSKVKVTLGFRGSLRPAYRRPYPKDKHNNNKPSKTMKRWGEANGFILSYKLTPQFNFLFTKCLFFLLQSLTLRPGVTASCNFLQRTLLPAQRAPCNRILVIKMDGRVL